MNLTSRCSIVFCSLVLGLVVAQDVHAGSIRITSPDENSVWTAGQTLTVTVEPTGTTLNKVTVMIAPIAELPVVLDRPPYTFRIILPSDKMGPAQIVALAQDENQQTLQAILPIRVESAEGTESLQVYYEQFQMSSPGRTIPLSLDAVTPTGKINVIQSEKTTIQSSNPKVAVIENNPYSGKQVRAVDYGVASVRFQYGNLTKDIPVLVGIWSTKGDLDGDGTVTRLDLDILNKALNQEVSSTGDPRDLNGDGRIDQRDADLMRSLCTWPNCAIHPEPQ